ncbi:MAG: endolytic transglycosylase MltG [Terriglobales bacterium]
MRTLFKLFVLLVLAAAAWLAWALWLPVAPKQRFVLLRPGWSTRHIAQELQSAGVVRNANAFLLYHYLKPRSLKAGEYEFSHADNALTVHDRIVRGDIYTHTVVIPEGFNVYEVAAAIEQAGLATRAEFLQVITSPSLVADLDPQAKSLEGYLFPDTYQFTRTQSPVDMAAVMVRRFRQEARSVGLLGTSEIHRIVTMASIVEKETAVPEERPMVASVYYNRLNNNIALAADPCIIYAALLAGRYDGVIRQSDLQLDSPYNTYKYPGLPPGPIANPGRASLEAALHPATTKFLYFVSDNRGHHRFARTLDEHARNVAAYRRAVNEATR